MSLRAMLGTAPKGLNPAVALDASRLALLGASGPIGCKLWKLMPDIADMEPFFLLIISSPCGLVVRFLSQLRLVGIV